jgi:hypothetical protein
MKTTFIVVCLILATISARRNLNLNLSGAQSNAQFFDDITTFTDIHTEASTSGNDHKLSVYATFSVTQSNDHNSMNLDAYNIAKWASQASYASLWKFTGNVI